MFIELHMLQNFAPSNLNRDDTNNPKDCIFGGVRRARISSQCIKRAIRLHPLFEQTTEVPPAERTRFLARALAKKLVENGKSEEDSKTAAAHFVGAVLGGMDTKIVDRSKVLFFVSEEEIQTLTELILNNWDDVLGGKVNKNSNPVKDYKKKFSNRTSAPSVAMFGRMLAEDPQLSIDAACQVAHAISTHRANMEFDFFTAVDDLQESEETGAGMMGIIGFNAATFYRYARIDFDQLVKNLDDLPLARKTVEAFLRASAHAVPTGKQTSFAAQNPPSFMMAVTRNDGMSWSLSNAFEKPVFSRSDQSLLEASIQALDSYWSSLVEFFGQGPQPVVGLVGIQPELDALKPFVVKDFQGWIDTAISALPKE
ncbi:MAG: type I-E CRISPR-associated protein Cas7/Cse4/CasC [Firmicutes bacterium]|jgi:CRISPR system Cascade subunit CasC|nr:type I-E CRISPR-associated protein Cas7/Cse4/CasC [Bacillota bacterium]